ncbi:MAG: transglutaminase domain-containing protein [Candidatus Omnitrophica bacterium]|nr:transglutaminase domain-containing protein [Candidatus Omnitrophota bacterium]
MKKLPVFLFLAAAAALAPAPSSCTDSIRAFEVRYEVRLPEIPPRAKELKIWIPLAVSDEAQKIRRRVIETAYPYQVTQDPEYGNDILFLFLQKPLPASLELSVEYEAETQEIRAPWEKAASPLPERVARELGLYLDSNRLMVVNDQVRELAGAVTAGARTPAERAHAIYRYVIETMRYDKETPGWGEGDTLRACDVGAGNCTDFHSLFISLARASGIPARFQIGIPVPAEPAGEIPGYHCWAEFYLEGPGWIPVDASEAWKHQERKEYYFGTHDPNRLAVSRGRDIRLNPKPSAGGLVNIFFFPYVEVDGKSVEKEKVETRFKFRDLAKKEPAA